MPDFDFDAFNHDTPYEGEEGQVQQTSNDAVETTEPTTMESAVADLTETPVEKLVDEPTIETTDISNDGPVDNGSSEVAEKW